MWAPEWEFSLFMVVWDTFGNRPFTVREFTHAVARDKDQLRVGISRLGRRGWLLRLSRGKYLAKPLDRIVESLRLYSKVKNAFEKAGVMCPAYVYGSVADLLASHGSDVDVLIVSDGGWEETELKLPDFHLTFITSEYAHEPRDFFIYTILKRGVPIFSRLEIPQASFDPEGLLEESVKIWNAAKFDGAVYEPHLIKATGVLAKYILCKHGLLPPTSGIGAILELAKVQEAYLEAFRAIEALEVEKALDMVMRWARKTR